MKRAKDKLPGLLIGAMDGWALERRVMLLLQKPWARRWRVVAGACCAVAMAGAAVSLGMFGVRVALAQSARLAMERFEVASVRLEDPHTPPGAYNQPGPNVPQQFPANRLTMRHTPLQSLVCQAYAVKCNYVMGGPDWIGHEHYDLDAKVEGDERLTLEQMRPLLKNLLQERFHLKVHHEQKVVPGYALVAGKGQPKLTPTKGEPFRGIMGGDELNFRNDTLNNFVGAIEAAIKQPVVDKTGIEGSYDLDLKFTPATGPYVGDARFANLPDIFTAVQEQLGLKLVAQKVTIDTLVIDHVDRVPTEN